MRNHRSLARALVGAILAEPHRHDATEQTPALLGAQPVEGDEGVAHLLGEVMSVNITVVRD